MAFSMTSILFCATSLALLLASPTYAGNVLYAGDNLPGGQSLSQGRYNFIMQTDCNLVLYDVDHPIWASHTNGRGSGCYLAMQRDGNLVIYSGGRAIWASNTNRAQGNFRLILQSDRNVVIYDPSGRAIWATGTNIAGSPDVVIEEQKERSGSTIGAYLPGSAFKIREGESITKGQ